MATIAPITPLALLLPLLFMLWFMSNSNGANWHNSLAVESLSSAKLAFPFLFVSVAYVLLAFFIVGKLFSTNSKFSPARARLFGFIVTEFPLLLGFVLAFVNKNAFLMAPFAAIFFALYLYVFTRSREISRK